MRKFTKTIVMATLATGALLAAPSAAFAKSAPAKNSHATYAIGKAKHCRTDFVKRTEKHVVKVRVKVNGKWKTERKSERYVACVRAIPVVNSAPVVTTSAPATGAPGTSTTTSSSASSPMPGPTPPTTVPVPTPAPIVVAPIIISDPTSETVTVGTNVYLSASASGTPTPNVQWQRSADGGFTWTTIAGETSTTFSFTAALTSIPYEYEAAFSNSGGLAVTTAATVTVVSTPTINMLNYDTTTTGLNGSTMPNPLVLQAIPYYGPGGGINDLGAGLDLVMDATGSVVGDPVPNGVLDFNVSPAPWEALPIGSGSTDCSGVINTSASAENTGCEMYFTPGTYTITVSFVSSDANYESVTGPTYTVDVVAGT